MVTNHRYYNRIYHTDYGVFPPDIAHNTAMYVYIHVCYLYEQFSKISRMRPALCSIEMGPLRHFPQHYTL